MSPKSQVNGTEKEHEPITDWDVTDFLAIADSKIVAKAKNRSLAKRLAVANGYFTATVIYGQNLQNYIDSE
jgi:hypothetical protein